MSKYISKLGVPDSPDNRGRVVDALIRVGRIDSAKQTWFGQLCIRFGPKRFCQPRRLRCVLRVWQEL